MANIVHKVGIICGSQRSIQAGHQITDLVQGVIKEHIGSAGNIELQRINLPLYDRRALSADAGRPVGPVHQGDDEGLVQDLGLSVDGDGTLWAEKKGDVNKGWDELAGLLDRGEKAE